MYQLAKNQVLLNPKMLVDMAFLEGELAGLNKAPHGLEPEDSKLEGSKPEDSEPEGSRLEGTELEGLEWYDPELDSVDWYDSELES
jgi:hypothetical protein